MFLMVTIEILIAYQHSARPYMKTQSFAPTVRLKDFLFRSIPGRSLNYLINFCLILHLAESPNNLKAADIVFGVLEVLTATMDVSTRTSLLSSNHLKTAPLGSTVQLTAHDIDPDASPMAAFRWFGPFASTEGDVISVTLPEGRHMITLLTED